MLPLFFSLLFTGVISHGSPHPVMGSSQFMQDNLKKISSKEGFFIEAADTNWKISLPDRKESLIYRVFKGPQRKDSQPTLSVRVEKLQKKIKAKTYIKRWVREYPYHGFKVLSTKLFKKSGHRGFVIDVYSANKQYNIRQAVFLKKKTAVVMTCSDKNRYFRDTRKACNKIIRTFRWKS